MRSLKVLCVLSIFGIAVAAYPGLARKLEPPANVGNKIGPLDFTDAHAVRHSLGSLAGKRATVVVFLSFDCPISKSYADTLAQLAGQYASRGVAFVGIGPDDAKATDLTRSASEFKLPFPVYPDDAAAAATAFDTRVTPEAFLLDGDLVLRYRGRIDNTYYARLKRSNQPRRDDLRIALDELLAGKPIQEPVTEAIGCPIWRETVERPKTGKVTFYRDVLPVLQKNCQTCHRPGELGPFSLMTYRQAVEWADDIKNYTQAHKMPPWKPVAGPAFRNERKLTDPEIATLAEWVDAGTPEGDAKDAPPPRHFNEGWYLGKPDLVLQPTGDMHIAPSGQDLFRCYVLPTGLIEDKYVNAVEFRPGTPRVVHHALIFIDAGGHGRKLEERQREKASSSGIDVGPGYSHTMSVGFVPFGGMGGWVPGQIPRFLPENTGYLLPRGADVVVQVHYHRDGRAADDRPSIGLYFAKKPVAHRYQSIVIPGRFTYIPAGNDHYRVQGSVWLQQDCDLHTVMPHMHMLGRQIKVTMNPADAPPSTLVAVDDWEYNWQETYVFKEPIHVKAGTRLDVEAYYDNSDKNPSNPFQPPHTVFFGEQTTNEMCFVFIGATSDKPGRIRVSRRPLDAKQSDKKR